MTVQHKILIADDDASIRLVLSQAFGRLGYQVRATGNATTLLKWVSEGEGDLVITDVVMPDENVFDVLPRIRKQRPKLPVIVSTGIAAANDAAGIDALRDLNDRMRALADGDPRYADLNREFHFTVYEHAGSPLLLSLMRLLWASLHGGPQVSRTHAESARQHDAIIDALSAGDAAAASARTYQHIMSAAPVPGQ